MGSKTTRVKRDGTKHSKKGMQNNPNRKRIIVKNMETKYPKNSWTHVYPDGSAMNATSNGGGEVVLKLRNDGHESYSGGQILK
jgi:hypothetical protein